MAFLIYLASEDSNSFTHCETHTSDSIGTVSSTANDQNSRTEREFFGTNEYKHIMALAAKINDLLSDDSFVKRGEKQAPVDSFAASVDWLMSEARRGQSIQRYKGLGEMNPDQLWDTTVNPETRRLMQVKIDDAVKADEIFTTLMGDQVEPRREFIEKNASTVENLDI